MWRRIAEQRIVEAMRRGEFDGLPGRGRPLVLAEESHIPPEWRMAVRLLKSAGLAPDWVMLWRELQEDRRAAHRQLRQAAALTGLRGEAWEQALAVFKRRISEINDRIEGFNLRVPSLSLQRARLDQQAEIRRALEDGAGALERDEGRA